MSGDEPKKKLVGPWQTIHVVIWVVGIYFLWTRGWWWPGILVLVGISALYEAYLRRNVPEAYAEEKPTNLVTSEPESPPVELTKSTVDRPIAPVQEYRSDLLPTQCPSCGAPIRGHEVRWIGPGSASCPYCGSNLPLNKV